MRTPLPAPRLAPTTLFTPALRRALKVWYRRARRPMPWRATRDPYRIWVSEIMLQQTQVATATPYYERFITRFPRVSELASAPLDEVLAAWSGLGYYRRARHLHAAAQAVVREHAGQVPATADLFGALPGIGRYTRGAVLSIGFGAAEPVLDGNVARVFARLGALPLRIKRGADAKVLWRIAEAALPPAAPASSPASPGEWNQALMELGATVCTPRAPRCGECPLRRGCKAYALGTPEAFPPPAPGRKTEQLRRAVVWIERKGRMLASRRDGALLAGLWEPPGVELAPGEDARPALRRALAALGIRARLTETGLTVRHTITHRAIEVGIWSGTLSAPAPRRAALRWADPRARTLALTATARKIAAAIRAAEPNVRPDEAV